MDISYINLKKKQRDKNIILILSFIHLFSEFIHITYKHAWMH